MLKIIAGASDTSSITKAILEYIQSYLAKGNACFYFFNPEDNVFEFYNSISLQSLKTTKPDLNETISFDNKKDSFIKAIKKSKPFFIPDTSNGEISLKILGKTEIKSLYVFPLKQKSDFFGILILFQEKKFIEISEDTLKIISDFIDTICPSLNNALKINELEKQKKKLNILLEHVNHLGSISVKINSTFNTDEILDEIIKGLIALFKFETISVYLKAPDKNVLECTKFYSNDIDKKSVKSLQGRIINLDDPSSRIASAYLKKKWVYDEINYKDNKGCILICPLVVRKQRIGVIGMSSPNDLELDDIEIKIVLNFSHQAASAISNSRLYKGLEQRGEKLERALGELAKHEEMSMHITRSLDIDETFNIIVQELQKLFSFESFSLLLCSPDNETYEIRKLFSVNASPDEQLDKLGREFPLKKNNGDLVSRCILENKTFYINDIDLNKEKNYLNKQAALTLNIKSLLIIPLKLPEKVIGAINIINHNKKLNFSDNDIKTIKRFALHIANATHNSRLYEQISEKNALLEEKDEIITTDLEMAKKIQTRVLTLDEPDINDLKLFVEYNPMQMVGGDLYDVRKLSPGHIRILIADMTGHGIQASLTTMLLKAEYEKINNSFLDPYEVLQLLNREYIRQYYNLDIFFTAFVVDIFIQRQKIVFSSGGHPEQVLLKKSGEIQKLISGGRLLGVKSNTEFTQLDEEYETGDKLFLFTDGIFEQFNEHDELYGEKRAYSFFENKQDFPLEDIHKGYLNSLYNFLGEAERNDDLTLISTEFK